MSQIHDVLVHLPHAAHLAVLVIQASFDRAGRNLEMSKMRTKRMDAMTDKANMPVEAVDREAAGVDIDALRALMAKATAGPWRVWTGGGSIRAPYNRISGNGVEYNGFTRVSIGHDGCAKVRDADYTLIVAAVNALPALLTELETLRAKATPSDADARVREALEPFAKCCEQISDDEPDDEWAKFRLTIGDYRRAKLALDALATPTEGGG